MNKIKYLLLSLLLAVTSCSQPEDNYKLSITAPSGAPAISVADLAYNQYNDYKYNLNQEAQLLQAAFASNSEDFIIAPINLGATMYNKTGSYLLAGIVTWGNLYFASKMENFTIESMNNQDVVFFGNGTINQYVVESILKHNNITPKNIKYVGDTGTTRDQLISNEKAMVLVAEPALSAAKNKIEGITSISVQDLYAEMTNSGSYPQAGCFVRKQTVEEHKSVVDSFIVKLEESCNKTKTNTEEIAGYAEELKLGGMKPVLTKAIPNCNINFVEAIDCKAQIETLFANALNYCGGKLPDASFYYQK